MTCIWTDVVLMIAWTGKELTCESTSQFYVQSASSLCSKALNELTLENDKWQCVTASQFRFTHASVGDLQV